MRSSLFDTSLSGPRMELSTLGSGHWDAIGAVDRAVQSVLADWFSKESRRELAKRPAIVERLLALRQAEAFPPGTREVRVAPGTVVTPLARDYLKRQGIVTRLLSREEVGRNPARGEWGFAVEPDVESGTVAAWRRALREEDWSELGSWAGSASWLLERPGRGALLVTGEASLAVWRACRTEGIRAAAAVDPGSVAKAVRDLGANLIAIEPAGKPISFLKRMGRTFRAAGAPEAPEGIVEEMFR